MSDSGASLIDPARQAEGPGFGRVQLAIHAGVATVLLIGAFLADWLTGNEVTSSLFYTVAIIYGAWFIGRQAGLVLAVLSVGAWIGSAELVGAAFPSPTILYWNVFAELAVYVIIAVAVAEAKRGFDRVRLLAARLAQSQQALDRESLALGNLQREMLPQSPARIPGYDLQCVYMTSTRSGGDYYDFFALPEGRWGILVADASGHGAPAAILMAMIRVLLHTAPEPLDHAGEVLARLNGQLEKTLPLSWFVTACYVVLDPATGRIEYSLAGHQAPLLVRAADGTVARLESRGGLPLGFMASQEYETASAVLAPGDTLVLHTDGLNEAMNKDRELFGEGRLIESLHESVAADPDSLIRRLLARVDAHRGGAILADDLTILALRRR